jgi:hypothetical protein
MRAMERDVLGGQGLYDTSTFVTEAALRGVVGTNAVWVGHCCS